jgi:hypothetical protein
MNVVDYARQDRRAVITIAAVVIVNAFLFLFYRNQTHVHIDAIAHVNKARILFDNAAPGLNQLGTIWLPLPHLLMAPLTWSDTLWTSGAAGSLLSISCFIGTAYLLFATGVAWTGSRAVGWLAFLFFALNPRLIYLFTTAFTEPLIVFSAAGLAYYLVQWTKTQEWRPFAMAALLAFAGTLTRYEGWAVAAAAVMAVPILATRQKVQSAILFAGAAAAGPLLWMLYNMVYFEDPLMFVFGPGSAQHYAQEYFFRTGKTFATAGDLWNSFATYFIDVAYCLNPGVVWLAAGGLVLSLVFARRERAKATFVLLVSAAAPFAFYVFNLYSNTVPILMPGLVNDQPDSIYNVRYGTVMAATLPLFAAFALHTIFRQAQRRRIFSFFLLVPLLLPNPIPPASQERLDEQLTQNLLYTEGIRNQSFWMPAFTAVAHGLKIDMDANPDNTGFILTNTRIVHPVVWATAIPMRRFVHEMNRERWVENLNRIDPGIRWAITEEGDQLWHAQGKVLEREWVEVARAKAASTGTVHLYRRP